MRTALFLPRDKPLLNLGLLGATLASTFGVFFGSSGRVEEAVVFSLSLVLILGVHEMGHYVLARLHGVDVSLPYFLPLPAGVGTLGAVIRIRGPIPHKNALVDIGAAGPLAGLLVAIPLMAYGLSQSEIVALPGPRPAAFPGDNSLWVLLPELGHYLTAKLSGTYVPAAPVTKAYMLYGDNLLLLGLQRLVLGPLPPGSEVSVHPTAFAAWFGMFVTMMNLVPIGQLDGGHLTHALWGARAQLVGKVVAVGLFLLIVFSSVLWLVWFLVVTVFIGFRHPEVTTPSEPLSRGRRWVCALTLLAFVLCAMPVPFSLVVVP
ncbi:MAG: site-2 protease family protein [Myxococcota bacterium]